MARATSAGDSITRASFVQLELAGRIGLPEGRYLVREDDSERVLVVQELDAERPQRRGRRRARPVDPGEPEQVPVTRVTVTGVQLDGAPLGRRRRQPAPCAGRAQRLGLEIGRASCRERE